MSDGRKALHKVFFCAVIENTLGVAEYMIENGADVNFTNKIGRTALIIASMYGNDKMVEMLVKHGANINLFDNDGKTALMYLCGNGKKETVEMLIDHGAYIDVSDNSKHTALMHAYESGNYEIMEILIKRGANINAVDNFGKTLLMLMSECHGINIVVEMLIAAKANIYTVDNFGRTALIYAYMYGRMETVKLLVEAGAVIQIDGRVTSENIKIKDYLESITIFAKQRRISHLNNSTRDFCI